MKRALLNSPLLKVVSYWLRFLYFLNLPNCSKYNPNIKTGDNVKVLMALSSIVPFLMGWGLIIALFPQNDWGVYILSLTGLAMGTGLFQKFHKQLMVLVIEQTPVSWSFLAQRELYFGLIVGFSLQGIALISLMGCLIRQVDLIHGGLYGMAIWLGLGVTTRLLDRAFAMAEVSH